jgi:hypothetical protein
MELGRIHAGLDRLVLRRIDVLLLDSGRCSTLRSDYYARRYGHDCFGRGSPSPPDLVGFVVNEMGSCTR